MPAKGHTPQPMGSQKSWQIAKYKIKTRTECDMVEGRGRPGGWYFLFLSVAYKVSNEVSPLDISRVGGMRVVVKQGTRGLKTQQVI